MKKDNGIKVKIYKRNDGATMIVAIIVMAILIVFTFSLTLVAYTLYSTQNKNIASMKCAEAANSLSKALEDEIIYYDKTDNRYPEYDSYLYRYLRYNLCQEETWPYYEEGTPGHGKDVACRYFDLKYNTKKKIYDSNGNVMMKKNDDGTYSDTEEKAVDSIEGKPGKVEVCIYWMLPKGQSSSTVTNVDNMSSRKGVRLFIEVTCEAASQSYTVYKEYVLDTPPYNVNVKTERTRQDFLIASREKEDHSRSSVNPYQFTADEIHSSEMWTWTPAYE